MGLPAGIPATITLVASSLLGVGLAHAVPKPDEAKFDKEQQRRARSKLRVQSCATCFVAAVFWVWALKNTLSNGFDLGVVSFLVVGSVAFNGALCAGSVEQSSLARQSYLFAISSFFVVANYVLGVFLVKGTLLIYMIIAALAWAANGAWGVKIIRDVLQLESELTPLQA
eukprot:TRINITY_DN33162_c0_g1_i1.p1 TRINITY_DN33162_c0_g1~~TRINITY_DN33162_c0_g1_i1.p1  ORF type:complete len:170 (-),score=21.99 TRINITY_DN33162_c0_g1_i1:23-532(-)